MRIAGRWHESDDGVVRPVLSGEIESVSGDWIKTRFLIDTGADCTVFSADVVENLGLEAHPAAARLGGVGGVADTMVIETKIRLSTDEGGRAVFQGRFAVVADPGNLDMSVIGRDILDSFALIVDRPGDMIALVAQRHRYSIVMD